MTWPRDNPDGMHTYECDGMPTQRGCGEEITISVPYVKEGRKKSGWLVTHATGDDDKPLVPIQLMFFCPSCADHVEAYDRQAEP